MKSLLAAFFAFSAVTIPVCQAATIRLSWTGQGLPGDARYGVHSIIPGESGSSQTFPQSLLSSSMEVHDGSIYFMEEDFTNRVARAYRTDLQSGSRTKLYEINRAVSTGEFAITDNYIYVSDSFYDTIWRTDLNGGNLETVYSLNPFTAPSPVYLAANEQRLFWTQLDVNFNGRGSIWSLNHANPSTPTLLLGGLNQPRHISVNSSSLFWFDNIDHKIYSMNHNGTNRQTLVSSVGTQGMAVDEDSLYWSEYSRIMRYDLASGQIETFLQLQGDVNKVFLDQIPEPGSWLLSAAGAGLMVLGRRRRQRGVYEVQRALRSEA